MGFSPRRPLTAESSYTEARHQEEYLVRKIAGKLNLTTADLMETKVRARERFLKDEL